MSTKQQDPPPVPPQEVMNLIRRAEDQTKEQLRGEPAYWDLHHTLAADEILRRAPGLFDQQDYEFLRDVAAGICPQAAMSFLFPQGPNPTSDEADSKFELIRNRVARFELNYRIKELERVMRETVVSLEALILHVDDDPTAIAPNAIDAMIKWLEHHLPSDPNWASKEVRQQGKEAP